jgi:hypothetical protein
LRSSDARKSYYADKVIRFLAALILSVLAHAQDSDTFRASRLTAVIGNNAAAGEHRAGYNGIFRLTGPGSDESAYVPAVAGLNLEHYFDARPRSTDVKVFFEPRNVPMQFRKINDTTAELRQDATPVYGIESRTVFELKDPYYVDVSYRGTPRRDVLQGGYLGIFWASYINAPLDKSIYFLAPGSTVDKPSWLQFFSQEHGRDATVRPAGEVTNLAAVSDDPGTLFRNLSPLRYGEPFYYGRVGDMVLIYIFRANPYLRFAHSPSGGGRTRAGDDTNPAWDFQLVIPGPQEGKEYGFDMRIVYKPWAGRADVLQEVRKYK